MAGVRNAPASLTAGRNVGARGTSSLVVQIGRGVAVSPVTIPCPPDLRLSWAAPGGDDTLTCTIPWPERSLARPDAFTKGMPIRVTDRRNGEILWAGRVADPGTTGTGNDLEFRLAAVGWGKDLEGIWTVKNYIDRDFTNLRWQADFPAGGANTGDGTGFAAHPDDPSAVVPVTYVELAVPNGAAVANLATSTMEYLSPRFANPPLDPVPQFPYIDSFALSWQAQAATTNFNFRVYVANNPAGSVTQIGSTGWPAAGVQSNFTWNDGVSAWPAGNMRLFYARWIRNGIAYTQGSPDNWLRLANMIVIGRRYDRYGVRTTPLSSNQLTVKPRDIIEDLLGTVLSGRVEPGTVSTASSNLVQQACWYDGAHVGTMLDAMVEVDAGFWWAVWAPDNPNGLPRLDWRPWAVAPRYTMDAFHPVTLDGGGEQMANRCLVTYLHPNGTTRATFATSISVPAITRVYSGAALGNGFRDMNLNLVDRGGMARETAEALGQQALIDQAASTSAGSATVTGAILDTGSGRLVQPWEIRPGWPVRLGSTPQRYDGSSGGPSTPNGETVFRLTQVTYSAANDEAELQLDGGRRSVFYRARRIAPFKPVTPRLGRS